MFERRFHIVEKSLNKLIIKRLPLIFFFLTFLLLFFIPDNQDETNFPKIFTGLILFFTILTVLFSFFMDSYKIKGEISFKNNSISFLKDLILLQDISLLKISVNDYVGKAHKGMYFGIGTTSPKEGINNLIEIETKNGSGHKFHFLIKYVEEEKILKRIMKFYEENNVNIEFISNSKNTNKVT